MKGLFMRLARATARFWVGLARVTARFWVGLARMTARFWVGLARVTARFWVGLARVTARFDVALLLAASLPLPASAQDSAFVHIVRPGETLASIAQTYYGNPKRENVLVAENGLTDQGGSAIVEGMRLVLPTVHYYRVKAGDTWRGLAERYYGDPARAPVLMKANEAKPGLAPDEGAQLVIPYPLRHVLKQVETLISVAEQYYTNREDQRIFRAINQGKGRLVRGHIVLVPLYDLVLSEEGKARLENATGEQIEMGQTRAAQAQIDRELPRLREAVQDGRFVEAVALGNQLLGSGQLTGYQEISIERELATAYMALSREDLAVQAFSEALKKQPDLELDSVRTSPRVLKALEIAKAEARTSAREPNQAHKELAKPSTARE